MIEMLPIAALTAIAAITPGPNNVLVLATATRGGIRSAMAVIGMIVLASEAMLLVADRAIDFAGGERLAIVFSVAGSLMMLFMAIAAWRQAGCAPAVERSPRLGIAALLLFQLMNPKGWLLVVTLASAGAAAQIAPAALAVLLASVTATCLAIWALAGTLIAHRISGPVVRLRADRLGAVLLAATALALPLTEFVK